MKTANLKPSKPHDKNSYIMNIMSLKLSETSRTGQRKGSLYEQTKNISNIVVINTPSTRAT